MPQGAQRRWDGWIDGRTQPDVRWEYSRLCPVDGDDRAVVEVAPEYDPTTNTVQLAAQLLFEEFALLSLAPRTPRDQRRSP